jgi:hypothetical protein
MTIIMARPRKSSRKAATPTKKNQNAKFSKSSIMLNTKTYYILKAPNTLYWWTADEDEMIAMTQTHGDSALIREYKYFKSCEEKVKELNATIRPGDESEPEVVSVMPPAKSSDSVASSDTSNVTASSVGFVPKTVSVEKKPVRETMGSSVYIPNYEDSPDVLSVHLG